MERFHQRSISFIMTAVYLLITLSPLASNSSKSNPFFQTLAKECSGDCRLCGCSAERSASQTCCCWQRKLAEAKNLKQSKKPQPCQTVSVAAGKSCCPKAEQHADTENEESLSTQADSAPSGDSLPVSISTCPCGSGKDLTFSSGDRSQHIPFRFASGIPVQTITPFAFLPAARFASRHIEPPDPPPKFVTS